MKTLDLDKGFLIFDKLEALILSKLLASKYSRMEINSVLKERLHRMKRLRALTLIGLNSRLVLNNVKIKF